MWSLFVEKETIILHNKITLTKWADILNVPDLPNALVLIHIYLIFQNIIGQAWRYILIRRMNQAAGVFQGSLDFIVRPYLIHTYSRIQGY